MSRVKVVPRRDQTDLIVRSGPGGAKTGSIGVGRKGSIVDDPRNGQTAPDDHGDGIHRWVKVRFDNGREGFVASEYLEPIAAAAENGRAAASNAFNPPGPTGFAGGGGPGPVGALVTLAVVLGIGYWIYSVVIPWIVENKWWIAFAFFLVTLFSGVARAKGLATAIVTTTIIGATGVGSVMVYRWYVEEFTGDFETNQTGAVLRALPGRRSDVCGEAVRVDQNLDCADEPCALRDTIEGRWVRVRFGTEACWAPYQAIRFQHGMFFSLIDHIYALRSTGDDDRSAVAEQVAIFRGRASSLHRSSQWSALANLGMEVIGAGFAVPESIANQLWEGMSRQRYAEAVGALRRASARDRSALVSYGRALPFPREKTELDALVTTWRASACEEATGAIRASTDPRESVRLFMAAATGCAPEQIVPLLPMVLARVSDPAVMTPVPRRNILRYLKDDPALASLPAPAREAVDAALQSASAEVRALTETTISDLRRQSPEDVVAAMLERGDVQGAAPVSPRDVARIRAALGQDVRRDAQRVLDARRTSDTAALAAIASLSVGGASDADRAVPPIGALGWRLGAIEFPVEWSLHATVGHERRERHRPHEHWTIPYCYSIQGRRWLPCGVPAQVGS